eukprot:8679465-Pyramimonas_sp.AAC.1
MITGDQQTNNSDVVQDSQELGSVCFSSGDWYPGLVHIGPACYHQGDEFANAGCEFTNAGGEFVRSTY